jgi:hypothetical protein
MRYFTFSGGTGIDSTKSALGHVMPNLCFCIRWDLRVTLCILVRLGHEISMHYFPRSGGTDTNCTKRASGHVTSNFSFLHHVGSVGHVVHSDASGLETSQTIFYARVGPVRIPQKLRRATLHRTCVSATGEIRVSSCAFRCL